jgi:type IV secretory pathway TrbF-like protein
MSNKLFQKAQYDSEMDTPLSVTQELRLLRAMMKRRDYLYALLVLVASGAFATVFPLKTVVPVRVETNSQTGEMVGKGELRPFTPDEANIRFWTGQFVLALTRVEAKFTEENLTHFGTFVTSNASNQWSKYLIDWNPFAALKSNPLYVRTAQLQGPPNLLGEGAVVVRVKLIEPDGRFWFQRWSLRYVINPPKELDKYQTNPAGIFITHLEFVTETQ